MIVQEEIGGGIVRTYSNLGVKVHGGFPESDYDIAYDPAEAGRTYVETNIPVESKPEGPAQYSKVKILLAAQETGFATDLITLIKSDPMLECIWNASNVIEDNELLARYLPTIAAALNKTEIEIKDFLENNCIVD